MKKALNKFAFWMAFGVLFLGAVSVAQTQQAVVKIICDKDGQEIYLDGEFKTTCDSGEPVRVIVPPGEHVVEAKRVNDDGSFFYFKKEFKIGGGVQKVIEVESEIGYTPEYYQKRCDSGSIDGCFFYLQNAEKKEPYWETAKLKYFELLCDKGSVRGCAYLHSIGKLSADEFRKVADRRLAELYAKDSNAKSELAKELLKYKVYLVDPEFYTHDIDYAREGEDDTERLGKFMIALFTGAYYAPVALYLDEDSGQAYYLLEVMGMPGGNVSPNLSDREEAPATLVVALSDGGTYKAAVAVEPKGKLDEYEAVLIAGRLEAEFAKRLPAQVHNLALKSAADSELASAENVVFAGVTTYSEDYLYQRATRTGDPAIYWAYLQLYPNGKYAQEVERGLDELFWAKCDTIKGCQVYLMAVGREPWAMHVAEAKQKIKEIESAKEKAAYEACKKADDVAPCNAYLEKYPEGQYAALVQLKINDIKRAEEKAAYEACKNASDPAPCLQYLNKYPKGLYKQVVELKVAEYQKAEGQAAYEACKNASDPIPCLQYLNKHPDGAHKQLATSRFMELSCGAGSARACLEQGRQEEAWRNLKRDLLEVLTSYKEVARKKFGARVYPAAFSPDGRYLAAGSDDRTLRVYRTADWQEVARKKFDDWVYPPTFSPDGRYLAAGSVDRTLRVYRTADWQEVARKEFGNKVFPPTFSPDGRYLVAGSRDHTLRVYRTADWQEVARKKFDDWVYSPAFSPDGSYLAARGKGTLRVYRTADWQEVARKKFDDWVYSPAFSPDGRYLAAGSKDRTLRVYRTADWQEVARKEFGSAVYSPTFSPDGRYLAAGSEGGTLRVYRTADWQEVTRKEFGARVYPPTFSPDGRYLAAGSVDRTLRVYRTADWEEVLRKEFGNWVYSPTFSPDGRYLVAGSRDHTLRVYHMPLSLEAFTIYAAARSVPARAEGLVLTPLALFSSGEENYYLVEVANESLKVRSRNLPTIQLYDQSGVPISGKLSPLGGDNLTLEPAGFAYLAFKLPSEVAEAVMLSIHNAKFTLSDGREVEAKYVIFSKKVQ